jgi:hypothetical protein
MIKTLLKSSISINFDDGHSFTTNSIRIENTPIVPFEGQSVRVRWDEILEDAELVKKLEDFEDDDMFVAHIGTIEFKKHEVITHIVLMAESDYNRHYGNLKA